MSKKSAVKRVQVAQRNRLRNKSFKSSIKTVIKKTMHNVQDINPGSKDSIQQLLSEAYSKIDKAIVKGIIKKNKGSRQKSKLLKRLSGKYED